MKINRYQPSATANFEAVKKYSRSYKPVVNKSRKSKSPGDSTLLLPFTTNYLTAS